MSTSSRFTQFLDNISLTDAQKSAGISNRESVIRCLNNAYYGNTSTSANSLSVGSWGKLTRVRPPRDVDVLFKLPFDVYQRFEQRSGNKQSQLLQEVKGYLANSFYSTNIKGDGPIVLVPLVTFSIEVIPAFLLTDGKYSVCMTDNGGRYKTADYKAEIDSISVSNSNTNNNTRDLIRIIKTWQRYCGVDIKSFWIEITCVDFLSSWEHRGKSKMWYDYMVRDYLGYLVGKKDSYIFAPGTYEAMNLGDKWEYKAKVAWGRAKDASQYEVNNQPYNAGDEWQKIFGTDMPRVPNA